MTSHHTTNGNALLAFLQDTVAILSDLDLLGYYQQPLPSDSDHQVRQVVDRFSTLSLGEQAQFLDGLADDRRPLFGIFGQRSATLSVREQDPAWLSAGLTGAVIANYHIPNGRPVEPALAVFYHCATELGLDPAVLFAVAARMASEDMALRLTDFGRKPEITLRHYGWKVVKTPDGVVFRNEWR